MHAHVPALRLQRVALPVGLLATLLIVRHAVSDPDLLHIDVALAPTTLVAAVMAIACCILVLTYRNFGLGLLVAAIYLNLSHVLVRQGFPSLLQLVVVPMLLSALASRPAREWAEVARRPLTWLFVSYTLVVLGSTTYAQAPHLADARVAETVKGLSICLLVVLLASSVHRIRLAAWTMVLAGALLAALGVLRVLGVGIPGISDALARVELAHIHDTTFEPRITGPLGDANFFAQILLILVPLGLFLAWDAVARWRRLLAYSAVALLAAATVLTYSRGGALALGFVLVLALMASRISWKRLALGGAVLASVCLVALPADFTARLATVSQILPGGDDVLHRDSSFEERRLLTGAAWEMLVDNPAFGVGAGNYTQRFAEYAERVGSAAPDYHDPTGARYPHNLYLEIGAETGVLGLTVFAAVLFAAFAALERAHRAGASSLLGLGGLARALQVALVGYLVSSLFLHGDFQRYLWLLLGMAGAMDVLAGMPRRAPRRTPDGRRGAPYPIAAGGVVTDVRRQPNVAPETRAGIAVLLSRFPSVTETFILREVIEMERQGQPVRLMPLLRESPAIVHPEAQPWIDRALYTPFLSVPILAANARAMLRHPWRYLTLVVRLVLGTLRSPKVWIGTIGVIPKSVYLAERARAEGVRHVHAHFATHPTTAAVIMAALADVSFSFTIHAHDLFSRKYRPLLRMKLDRAAFVRVISRYNLEHLRALYPSAPLHKVHVIHVGIETGLYGAIAAAAPAAGAGPIRAQCEPEPMLRLISVAALRDYKGLPVLLEACRRLIDDGVRLRCDVVGEGPMRPHLERMICDLDLQDHVRLLGAKPQHEVRRLLAERPIFVLSSIVLRDGWMEGIPVALMEAMASGAAVVTSRISGIPELVEHGVSGLLVEPGDSAALAGAIRELASASVVQRRLGATGRARVDAEFRLDDTVSALLALIDAHNAGAVPPLVRRAVGSLRRHTRGAPVGVRAIHHGTDALVAQLVVPDGRRPARQWVLKIHHDHPGASRPAAARARHECTVLASLRDGWAGGGLDSGPVPRFGVPDLRHESAGEAWLVMESCGGETLATVLRASRASRDARRWSSALVAVRQSGEWLRGLQQRAPILADADTAFAAWHDAVEADLARCGTIVSRPLLFRAQTSLHELVRAGASASSIGVLHHGDFWPGNIFAGERLQVIDFEGARAGLPYEDVAYFVVQLQLFLNYPLLRGRCRQAVSVFLEGYLDGETLDGPAYRMATISKTLQILGRVGGSRPAGLAARRRYAALCRMLAEACA